MRAINLSAPAGNATPLIVRALLDASEGDTIRLNGGVWHFYEDGACERYAAPSNNANGIKKIIFPLIDKRNVAVDGGGATLLFHDRVFPFVVSGCEDVRVENVTIDFSFPRYAVATALESDERGFSLRVDEARFPWFVQDGCWAFRAGSALRTTAEKKFFLAGGMKNRVCCYLAAGDTRDPLFNLAAPLVRADARRTEAERRAAGLPREFRARRAGHGRSDDRQQRRKPRKRRVFHRKQRGRDGALRHNPARRGHGLHWPDVARHTARKHIRCIPSPSAASRTRSRRIYSTL